jgi:restriction system-associated AAA family ATPase
MKIVHLHISESPEKPLLTGLELNFPLNDPVDKFYPNVLIGVNGSGKSQLLETLAEIFLYLDRVYRKVNPVNNPSTTILFELEYIIFKSKKYYNVLIKRNNRKDKEPLIEIKDATGSVLDLNSLDFNDYLPSKVIGYTSGDNETLSLPFTDYYDEYAKYTANRAKQDNQTKFSDYDPRFYLMDYNTNIGVLISNLILGKIPTTKRIANYVGIDALRSFQIVIQTKHNAAPKKRGVELTKELEKWINELKKSATCYHYFPKEKKHILDFYMHGATKKALCHFFNDSSIDLYTALYKIELLNNLIIKDQHLLEIKKKRESRKLIIKPPTVAESDKVMSYSEVKLKLKSGETIDYLNLSDGEHQFLNIFGTLLMTDSDNCLYLLDEPETHFNPTWRREFISLLTQLISNVHQDYFLTSHSPFIVADTKREYVYIFRRTKNKLKVESPIKETFGSDFDYILKTAFDLDTSISTQSYKELNDLLKNGSLQDIQQGIDDFGDSAEKLFLFKRLEELKNQKGNKN